LPLSLILILGSQVTLGQSFNHSPCKLEKTNTIKIGCTKYCGKSTSKAIKKISKKLGYKVELSNIYSSNSTPDLTLIDAVIIPGGVDIDPSYYLSEVETDLREHIQSLDNLVVYSQDGKKRDPFEFNMINEYFNNSLLVQTPILGICRGMQMLGVSQGIPLYVDIKAELGVPNRYTDYERITIKTKDSELFKIIGSTEFKAVEKHHQGPRVDYFKEFKDQRWPNINMTAFSNNGKIAEALEWTNRPVLGVQFHPEYKRGSVQTSVFSWLLKQACHNSNSK
jgi:putative glutamine amidotransferase